MSSYSENLSLTVTSALADVASAIGRAIDPDVGGADSFKHPLVGWEGQQPIYDTSILVTRTACTPELKAQALFMVQHPEALFAACVEDYAKRWPDFTPPTLEDCTAFCAAVTIE